jgi:hypothetical protein
MKLTPRAVDTLLFVAERRRKRQFAEMLGLMAMATRGEKDAVKRQLEQLSRD